MTAGYWMPAPEEDPGAGPGRAELALTQLARDVSALQLAAAALERVAGLEEESQPPGWAPEGGHELRSVLGVPVLWHETVGSRRRAQEGSQGERSVTGNGRGPDSTPRRRARRWA